MSHSITAFWPRPTQAFGENNLVRIVTWLERESDALITTSPRLYKRRIFATLTCPLASCVEGELQVMSSWHGMLQSLNDELHDRSSTRAGRSLSTSTSTSSSSSGRPSSASISDESDSRQLAAFRLWFISRFFVVLHIKCSNCLETLR